MVRLSPQHRSSSTHAMGCTQSVPSRDPIEGDVDGDTLRDAPLLSLDEATAAAKSIGLELAPDQASLFASNAWSPFEKSCGVCTKFTRVKGNIANGIIKALTTVDKPRFLIGRYEYREAILSLEPRYTVVGYLDHRTRILRASSGLAVSTHVFSKSEAGIDVGDYAQIGDQIAWEIKGCSGKAKHVGVFTVCVKKIGGVDTFFSKNTSKRTRVEMAVA